MKYKCRICGQEVEHKTYQVREMFFGTREEFTYFECENCQCLQIAEIPDNLGDYYRENYYSFSQPQIPQVIGEVKDERYFLDVGCGAGKWLLERYAKGCVNLYGCDPFIEEDIHYEPCITIKKCTIHEMKGTFDVISLSDSFEHMADPYETLQSIERLLSDDGFCLISMPVFPNAAYDICGVNWYEWDAPRHLFLHSVKSMEYLCSRTNLQIVDVIYNASELQFLSSLLYQQGIPFTEHSYEFITSHFTADEIKKFEEYTEELNAKGYSDHAAFVLMKK